MNNTLLTRPRAEKLFEAVSRMRALIIGDVMVDSYIWGTVDRISPEAPVPVVNVNRRLSRLGGAANVALNVKAMDAMPILCSVCGKDEKGKELIQLMQSEGLPSDGIVLSNGRISTTKFRIIGNNTQMLRVDEETTTPLSMKESEELLFRIRSLSMHYKPDLIIFEDYDKGVISPWLLENVIALANSNGIPVCVDPKQRNFTAYRNISLFKPNLKEFREGIKLEQVENEPLLLEEALRELRDSQTIDMVLLTLSEAGMMISYEDECVTIPSHVREVADVSGAGDTVISVASLLLAAGAAPLEMTTIANLAAAQVCGQVGVVPVNRQQLREAVFTMTEK